MSDSEHSKPSSSQPSSGLSSDTFWKHLLELRLRKTNGNAFQEFFSDIMQARYGSDFVRLKPYGQLGDDGCDGYLQSTGEVYQCYGAQNGGAGPVSKLIGKMNADFATANTKLTSIMKSWRMTHNIVEGLPVQAIKALDTLKKANANIVFGFLGPERIHEIVGELTDQQRADLLGPAARAADYQGLQIAIVKDLVDAVIVADSGDTGDSASVEEVSPEKLAHNKLPSHWIKAIRMGRINHKAIDQYFDQHPEPLRGEKLAQLFRERYAYLKSQSLSAEATLNSLYAYVAGDGDVTVQRTVAAHSILAYLFESCDILENAPVDAGIA